MINIYFLIIFIACVLTYAGIQLYKYNKDRTMQKKLSNAPLFTQCPEYQLMNTEDKITLLHGLILSIIHNNQIPDIEEELKRIYIKLTPIIILLRMTNKIDKDNILEVSKLLNNGYVSQAKAIMIELEDATKSLMNNMGDE